MTLHFSAPDWCFYNGSDEPDAYYARLREIGISAAEMVPAPRRAAARKAGLTLLNHAASGMEKGLNDPSLHASLLPAVREAIREAAGDGIPHVIVFSGNRLAPGQNDMQTCRKALELLLPLAESSDVTLVFEVLNSFDHAGYEADRIAYGAELGKQLNSPRFKLLVDLYHVARMGDDPLACLKDHLPQTAHLHVAGSPKRDFPGVGQDVDFAACVRYAAARGYAGYWGMEFLPGPRRLDALAEAVRLFREYAAKEPAAKR